MVVTIRVGDVWLRSIGDYGQVVVTDRFPGGCWSLDWEMALPSGVQPEVLSVGAYVQAYAGGLRWAGILDVPDWNEGKFSASGLSRIGENLAAVDTLGDPTAHPMAAVLAAIGRGALPWGTLETFTAVTDDPPTTYNTVSSVLNAYCEDKGKYWGVDQTGYLWVDSLPTSPGLFIAPGAGDIGTSTDTQVTHLYATYLNRSYRLANVIAASPVGQHRVERIVDLTERGPLTEVQAQALVDSIVARTGTQTRLTSGLTVSYGQITDARGQVVELSEVRPRGVVQANGIPDPRTQAANTRYVVGETVWDVTAGTVQINPLDQAPTDFAAVIEAEGGSVIL